MITSAIKTALRISHSGLDAELQDLEKAARAEMVRAGVDTDKAASDTDALIVQAIKTYCKAEFAQDQVKGEKFMESFKYQLDNLRKSIDYAGAADAE